MDSYNKEIELKIKAVLDKDSADKVKKDLEQETKLDTEAIYKSFKEAFSKMFSPQSAETIGKNIASGMKRTLDKTFNDLSNSLKDVFRDAWNELSNIMNYSLLSNERTRELAFTYGFSGSQAYGYDKAMQLMGFSSIEDLMYATPKQKSQFENFMTKYTEKYTQLYDSGFFDKYLDFQYEMENFKQEVMLEIVEFYMNNKDLIKDGLTAIMKLSEFTIQALGWIVEFFSGGRDKTSTERAAITTDIVNSYSNSSAKNTNVKIDNTFNNVAKSDQTWLANAGQMTYEQIIKALQ